MQTAYMAREEDVMTDYQYKSMMAMVHEMFAKCETVEDYKEVLRKITALSGGLLTKDKSDKGE